MALPGMGRTRDISASSAAIVWSLATAQQKEGTIESQVAELKGQITAAGHGRPEPIVAKFSQETLAEIIGMTRPRVGFFMNKFRELGLNDYNGQIEVHSSLLNVVLREKPEINER